MTSNITSTTSDSQPVTTPVLEARDLTKHFTLRGRQGTVHAVESVNLRLMPGEVVALVGESGSGKSTVARLLAHLIDATSGDILLRGSKSHVRGTRQFRRYCNDVQMILQDPFASLNSIHPVKYTLSRAVRIHNRHMRYQLVEQRVCELLEAVQLTPGNAWIDKFPHELSGGQRQRVSIARALAADPVVLLADEPISMLDVSMRIGVLNLLASLRDDLDVAILYITHDVASARYFADRTVVMYAGQIVEEGVSEDVTQRPIHPYTRLLVSSAPDPDTELRDATAHRSDRGEPPSLVNPPTGCRFHPRCPLAGERCRTSVPPLVEGGPDGHRAACWATTPGGVGE